MMGLSRFIAFLALLGLSFVSALLFEARLTKGYYVELIVLIIGLIFSLIAVFSLLGGGSGGWFLATLIFGAALVNSIVLFLIVKSFSLLILAVVINITGMIFSVLSAAELDDDGDDGLGLETYDIEDEDDFVEVIPKKTKKKTAKRKTTKKKSQKKKNKRKKRK